MTPVQFYRGSLLAPLVLPIVLFPVAGFLLVPLAFGGLEYIVFATVLGVIVGRLKTAQRIQRLARWAPVLFVPIQALSWIIQGEIERTSNPGLVWIYEPLPLFAVYVLIFGYAYVALVAVTFRIVKARGHIEESAL